ncbi:MULTISPECIES: fimbrial protein [unclassified Burkholderia]|uniref:fimbrial protein n=1 Tax=unclassified Burkholderia TaxID=2613784 RepID=UPI001E37890D|nr:MULTISPECIES: fimbrial protein [unclassified Burkholderia]UEP28182.1 fimbrial protein [Burkholderia sp. B21-007]UEP41684.1 fimbrial protein [Burkholderia sp. B21-005]
MMADTGFGRTIVGHAALGGFNLLPYRERLAQALRRRRVTQCGAAIVLGVFGACAWTGAQTVWRWRVDAERARVQAQLRQWQPQVAAARRAAGAAADLAQRDARSVVLAAPYRHATGLLATLAQVRDDTVRLDALRTTSSGAVLDARATSYRAAARWLARIAAEQRDWRFDIGMLTPASATPVTASAAPFRFSVQVRWYDALPHGAAGGGA